jgi:uncharacterized membrane protein
MPKNRIIIILAILIFLVPRWSGFTPSTKVFLIELLAVVIIVLAFLIEKKDFFSLLWHKKNTTTPVAHTYVEHHGAVSAPATTPIDHIAEPI